jgi:hypothetical protein
MAEHVRPVIFVCALLFGAQAAAAEIKVLA